MTSKRSSTGSSRSSSARSNATSATEVSRRVARVEREVQQVVSEFILRNLRDELPGLVTVGRVLIPGDLRSARVFVSLLDPQLSKQPDSMREVLHTLNDFAPDIQSAISKKIQMKYLPKLHFEEDKSTEKILKVEGLLGQLSKSRNE